MQTVAEGQGDHPANNNKRYRRQIMKAEEGVPNNGRDEIDRIADFAQRSEYSVGKAFKAKGGLIESKTDEDTCSGEDDPGHACGDIGR